MKTPTGDQPDGASEVPNCKLFNSLPLKPRCVKLALVTGPNSSDERSFPDSERIGNRPNQLLGRRPKPTAFRGDFL